jgi:hypothetical protein
MLPQYYKFYNEQIKGHMQYVKTWYAIFFILSYSSSSNGVVVSLQNFGYTGSYSYTIDIVIAWVIILLFFQALTGPLFITQVKNEYKVMMWIIQFMSVQNKLMQISPKN